MQTLSNVNVSNVTTRVYETCPPPCLTPSPQRPLQNAQSPVSLQSEDIKTVEFQFEDEGAEEREGAEEEEEGAEVEGAEVEGAEEEGAEEGAEQQEEKRGRTRQKKKKKKKEIKSKVVVHLLHNHDSLLPSSYLTSSERLEVEEEEGLKRRWR